MNPLASINGKAHIFSPDEFLARYPAGRVPAKSKNSGKTFICRRGCNTRTATYTDDFVWEQIYGGKPADIDTLIASVQKGTKATRRRKRDDAQDASLYVSGVRPHKIECLPS